MTKEKKPKKEKEYSREQLVKKATLRPDEVQFLVGFSRSSLRRRILDSNFPTPMKVGPKTVRWNTMEVVAWNELQRVRKSDAA